MLKIGSDFHAQPYTASKIVGIDEYSLSAVSGFVKKWVSYTLLESNDQQRRWWMADFPDIGRHIILPEESSIALDGTIDSDLTGLATINSHGNSDFSEGRAGLITFRRNGTIFSLETFEGMPPLFFKSVPV